MTSGDAPAWRHELAVACRGAVALFDWFRALDPWLALFGAARLTGMCPRRAHMHLCALRCGCWRQSSCRALAMAPSTEVDREVCKHFQLRQGRARWCETHTPLCVPPIDAAKGLDCDACGRIWHLAIVTSRPGTAARPHVRQAPARARQALAAAPSQHTKCCGEPCPRRAPRQQHRRPRPQPPVGSCRPSAA